MVCKAEEEADHGADAAGEYLPPQNHPEEPEDEVVPNQVQGHLLSAVGGEGVIVVQDFHYEVGYPGPQQEGRPGGGHPLADPWGETETALPRHLRGLPGERALRRLRRGCVRAGESFRVRRGLGRESMCHFALRQGAGGPGGLRNRGKDGLGIHGVASFLRFFMLFSQKKQTLFPGKAPLKAPPICAKSADAVSGRLRRARKSRPYLLFLGVQYQRAGVQHFRSVAESAKKFYKKL